jgi:hypothetical protein
MSGAAAEADVTVLDRWFDHRRLWEVCPPEGDEAGQAKWNDEILALKRQIATTPSETLRDIAAKMWMLRHWREQGTVPGDNLKGYLIHGVIADLEKMNSPISS